MSYIDKKDLGFNKDGLLFLRVHGNTEVVTKFTSFKNELLSNSLVSGVSRSNSLPLGGFGSAEFETVNGKQEPLRINMAMQRADPDYLNVYGLKLLAGNNFTPNASTDTLLQLIVNEEAVKTIGWKDAASAIGKTLRINNNNGTVVGVIRNFHFSSLQQLIEPMVINPRQGSFSRISVKIDLAKSQEAINWIQSNWKKHFPTSLFDYDFIDRQRADQYKAEERFSSIFLSFSILSLVIACLGLYGLIAYATTQKTKEIGIRKVLGASAHGIAIRLSFDFLKLVCLASFVAIPVSIYIMSGWLQEFAYRTDLSWWMFALSISIVLIVALVTVSFQAIKAGMANPVKSLKME
jgi:putative ABC transport system permease protein